MKQDNSIDVSVIIDNIKKKWKGISGESLIVTALHLESLIVLEATHVLIMNCLRLIPLIAACMQKYLQNKIQIPELALRDRRFDKP